MISNKKQLEENWDELNSIFKSYKGWNKKTEVRLQKLGCNPIRQGKHIKLYFGVDDKIIPMTISLSPSDTYAGKQILRTLRRIYNCENHAKFNI